MRNKKLLSLVFILSASAILLFVNLALNRTDEVIVPVISVSEVELVQKTNFFFNREGVEADVLSEADALKDVMRRKIWERKFAEYNITLSKDDEEYIANYRSEISETLYEIYDDKGGNTNQFADMANRYLQYVDMSMEDYIRSSVENMTFLIKYDKLVNQIYNGDKEAAVKTVDKEIAAVFDDTYEAYKAEKAKA